MLIKGKNNGEEEHNTGSDRYLITYADLITLLLGLFVILYASSQIDVEKYSEFSQALSEMFSPGTSVLEGGDGVLDGDKAMLPEPVFESGEGQEKSLAIIESELQTALKEYLDSGSIELRAGSEGLELSLSENLLFDKGKALIRDNGSSMIDTLTSVLRSSSKQISVDGHTDSDPIRTFQYQSNWHLSVSRATNVAYQMIKKGVPENFIIIRGFGSQRPLLENNSEENKQKNRRVEIIINELQKEAPSTEGYSKIDSSKTEENSE